MARNARVVHRGVRASTCEPGLDRAVTGAAVKRDAIAIVALLSQTTQPVTTHGTAYVGAPDATTQTDPPKLHCAVDRAPTAGTSIIALLVADAPPVAADGRASRDPTEATPILVARCARVAKLHLAEGRTAIKVVCIAVVALLLAAERTIATHVLDGRHTEIDDSGNIHRHQDIWCHQLLIGEGSAAAIRFRGLKTNHVNCAKSS